MDQCPKMCMRYKKCMENQASGLPDMKTCFQPPCNCDAKLPVMDQCPKMCMRYKKCMENQASGLPDMKTCFQPPCNCDPKPETIMCEGGPCPKAAPLIDEIIHRCETMCMRYSKCRIEGSKPCMMPPGCNCVAMPQPESEMCEGGPCPKAAPVLDHIIDRCDTMCMRYAECRAQRDRPCMMPPGCKCVAMPPMAAGGAKAMPCLGPQCQPEDDENMPLHNFCNVQCNMYKKCRGEKNPPMPCFRPPGCMCEEVHILPPMGGKPLMDEKSKMLIPPPLINRCMEPCKEYWQCRIEGLGMMEKPHLTCPKPSGCMCDCMTAGVCDQVDVAKIKSKVIEPVPAAERCAIQHCAQYWNCQVERLGRPEKQLLNCLKPKGCRCECLTEEICLREHFIPDPPMPMPVEEMCSKGQCADYMMCMSMVKEGKKIACYKPMGCMCDCTAAGVCN